MSAAQSYTANPRAKLQNKINMIQLQNEQKWSEDSFHGAGHLFSLTKWPLTNQLLFIIYNSLINLFIIVQNAI